MEHSSIIKNIAIEMICNGIVFLKDKELTMYTISSVENYKVINRKKFIKDFKSILEKNEIYPNIKPINISIIIDKTYKDVDKKNMSLILKLLRFNKIEYLDISNILDLSPKEIAVDISENNLKVFYKQSVYHSPIYFSKYQEILHLYLQKMLKIYEIETIKIFGNYKEINKISEYLEKKLKIKTLIFAYSNIFPINLLT